MLVFTAAEMTDCFSISQFILNCLWKHLAHQLSMCFKFSGFLIRHRKLFYSIRLFDFAYCLMDIFAVTGLILLSYFRPSCKINHPMWLKCEKESSKLEEQNEVSEIKHILNSKKVHGKVWRQVWKIMCRCVYVEVEGWTRGFLTHRPKPIA